MSKAPWEADEAQAVSEPATVAESPSEDKAESTPSSDAKAPWMDTKGFSGDMEGDPQSGGSWSESDNRYWMPAGSERRIVFLTEGNAAPIIYEHQMRIGSSKGAYRNWATCLKPLGGPCALCDYAEANNNGKRYKGMFFTVIDCSEYKSKKTGETVSHQKRLMCCKKGVVETLTRKFNTLREEGKGLRGAMFTVYRKAEDKSPSTGEEFDYIKHVDLSAGEDTEEYNYAELLKPDPDKVKEFLARLGAGSGTEGTDQKVNFG